MVSAAGLASEEAELASEDAASVAAELASEPAAAKFFHKVSLYLASYIKILTCGRAAVTRGRGFRRGRA